MQDSANRVAEIITPPHRAQPLCLHFKSNSQELNDAVKESFGVFCFLLEQQDLQDG